MINFQILKNIISHYKEIPTMNNEYDVYIELYITKRNILFRNSLENDKDINDYLKNIKNNISLNEQYLYEDFERDFDKLKYIIEKKVSMWSTITFFIFGLITSPIITTLNKKRKQRLNDSFKYVGNSQSKKFHEVTCHLAKQINSSNRQFFNSKSQAHLDGYQPCKKCQDTRTGI